MNGYLALGIAIIAGSHRHHGAQVQRQLSPGLVPSLISIAGYGTALYLLTCCRPSKTIILTGVTYAIWSRPGHRASISITSFFFHHQKIDLLGHGGHGAHHRRAW